MPEPSDQTSPRNNPFWAYRDPHSGRWVTLMTAAQCQKLSQQVFAPKNRQSQGGRREDANPPGMSAS